ncbi:jg16896 [Pararge aegeria aegeria]|uniref:Jg16896 protein n=1 Tax=Pararge aegeria aegeria TaxID=348720 RepID=A0A8S4SJ41_9NEOP|nr:jg16896 [Pararge aegeria aegeria]
MKVWLLGILIVAAYAKHEEYDGHLNLEDQMFTDKVSASPSRIGGRLPYNQYQSVEAIHKYMDDVAAAHPNIARVVTPTNSFHGQPMKYMRISTTNFQDSRKPVIFLDGGMHGREWLSIPPVTYAINQLVENVTDPTLLSRFDWILLPIVNPDGYRFSRQGDDQLIEAQRKATLFSRSERVTYENYQPLEVIYEYMDTVARKYSQTVTLVTPANSFEGRPIKYLKISKDNFKSGKPVIFLDAGLHAREWITIPTVTYAIHKLVENVTEPDLLDKFDWILFPVVNPDGYKYSYDVVSNILRLNEFGFRFFVQCELVHTLLLLFLGRLRSWYA